MKRNPTSPWNPSRPCDVTPKEFEKQVLSWLELIAKINSFSFRHRKNLSGVSGEYEFDGVVKLEVFRGAEIIILIECKRYRRPIEREKLLSFYSKLQEVRAHKAMFFSTSGFQSGALGYAKNKGIACLTFVNGDFLYETRDYNRNHRPPPWANIPKYSAILLEKEGDFISCNTIDKDHVKKLKDFITNQ